MLEDTCVTPIYSLDEVAADPHFRERGSIVDAENLGPDAKRQVGRRLYFEARVVADAIDRGLASPPAFVVKTEDGCSRNKDKTLPS